MVLAGSALAAPSSWQLPQVIWKPVCQGSSAPGCVWRSGTARVPCCLQVPSPALADSRQLLTTYFFLNMLPCIFLMNILLAYLMFEVREEVDNTYYCRNMEIL